MVQHIQNLLLRLQEAARAARIDSESTLESSLYIWLSGGWAMIVLAAIALFIFALGFGVLIRLRSKGFRGISEATWRRWIHEPEGRRGAVGEVFDEVERLTRADKVDASPFPPFPGLTRAQELSGEYPIIFPNVMLGIQRDHFYCIITDPLAHDRTRERVHLYMVGDAPARPDYQPAFDTLVETWKEVFEEDVWVVERMQLGRASDAFGGGVLTPYHDDLTQRFMQRVTESLAK